MADCGLHMKPSPTIPQAAIFSPGGPLPPPTVPGPTGSPLRQVEAVSLEAGEACLASPSVAREVPCEIRLNGASHTILMASPGQLEELALGHCLSEGLIERPHQVELVNSGQTRLPALGAAHWVDVRLDPLLARRAKLRRLAPAASSCSLCGLESLRHLPREMAPLADDALVVEMDAVFRLLEAMESRQEVFSRTGGTHAAALGTTQGELISLAEDIGRHNALDKALGAAILRQRAEFAPRDCLAMLSGRMSYEMALKVARVGLPVVASVSAPTGLCVDLLRRLNITLIAFCRPPRATIYTHPRRVAGSDQPPPPREDA
jgi:FdhD protein